MQFLQSSLFKPPYGLAFSIEDLVHVREWAAQRDLRLLIALDQNVDGAEFEELLIIAPQNRTRRTLTIWRTQTGLFAQTPRGQPQGFANMTELLGSVRPVHRQRSAWLQFLGF